MIGAAVPEAMYGLSPSQEAMLLQSRRAAPGMYVGQLSCRLVGQFDVPAFRRAWERALARHGALRTGFWFEGMDTPLQFVLPQTELPFTEQDLQDLPPEQAGARIAEFLERDLRQPFDFSRPPLMRLSLLHLSSNATQFIWTRHHILLDGWSADLLLREVLAGYTADRQGLALDVEPAPGYQSFVDWLSAQDVDPARRFWKEQLDGFSEPTYIAPTDVARGDLPAGPLLEEELPLDLDLVERIDVYARHAGITAATVYAGAWALLVGRCCGREDTLFGLTVSGRPAEVPAIERIVGLFLNTVPLRSRAVADQPLTLWLQDLNRRLDGIRQHQHLPPTDIRQLSSVPGGRELFDHILVIEHYPGGDEAGDAGLRIEDYRFIDQTSYGLNIGVSIQREARLNAVYDPARYSERFITTLLGNFAATLVSMTGLPNDALVGRVDCLSRAERQRVLVDVNRTTRQWQQTDLLQVLADACARQPEAEAVKLGDQALSYEQLARASDALASRIARQVQDPEPIVAICATRSLELVVAILSIFKAGGAFLPLDADDPPARLQSLLRGASVSLVLTQQPYVEPLTDAGAPVTIIDPHTAFEPAPLEPFVRVASSGSQAAYVLYTSGSTGKPKPVLNERGALLNRLLWMQSAYPLSSTDRVLQKTAYTFDVSVWEFLWPLMYGATLVLAEPDGHRDPAYIRDLIVREQVTVVHFVPSMLRLFLEQPGIEACTSLRHVMSSGEALSGELRDRFHRRLRAQLHNLYGPTEAAIDVCAFDCAPEDTASVPLGRPIANAAIYLLDRQLQPVPAGVLGEIFIGGRVLARGYHGQPDRTAERFLPDPFSPEPGTRMYRTGDRARLLDSGQVAYAGRADFQVKIRGMRVEPGEVEGALRELPIVKDCAVLPDLEGTQLVAHVVPHDLGAVASSAAEGLANDLRTALAGRLPPHMVPARFVLHPELPLTASGKLDRAALRSRSQQPVPTAQRQFQAPRTDLELSLAGIWCEVLGRSQVGVRDNFFELGGHSLSLAQVSTRIDDRLQVHVPLRELFNAQTISQMAELVMDRQLAQADPEELAELMEEVRGLSPEEVRRLLEDR
jgi:amino acid adenylation domain-containing protein